MFKKLLIVLILSLSLALTPLSAASVPLSPAQVSALDRAYGDSWRAPLGPYHLAPPEYGAGWWYVSPFTGPTPWTNVGPPAPPRPVPVGFTAVFGPEPGVSTKFRGEWLTNLQYFKGIGTPPGFTDQEINLSISLFEGWGLGTPIFYEGRYGWNTRFPNQSELWDFDTSVSTAIKYTHFVIANYQIRLVQETGAIPSRRHPFVPPQVFGQ